MTLMPVSQRVRILVVDDDPGLLDLIEMRLIAGGYSVIRASSGEEAIERFRSQRPRVVISDLRMDGMDGHELFAQLHREAPTIPVIMLTAHGTIPDAVAATQRGVFGFLTKPFDGRELLARVAEAVTISPCIDDERERASSWRQNIVSASRVMEELLRKAHRAAATSDPILISGARGTGKEALARAIHAASSRASKPFVTIQCGDVPVDAAQPVTLAQALSDAGEGTLLLKDVEGLPLADQLYLLPLVREPSLFSMPSAKLNNKARVIASTSQSLEPTIRDGQFRADLFYGLCRTGVKIPPLAERRDDIPMLVSHFLAEDHGLDRGFAPDALSTLLEAAWPGNVRQLRHLVAVAVSQSITAQIPASIVKSLLHAENEKEISTLDEARRVFEYDYLVHLLKTTHGNVTNAARLAQRNRTEFYKLIAKHNLDPKTFK